MAVSVAVVMLGYYASALLNRSIYANALNIYLPLLLPTSLSSEFRKATLEVFATCTDITWLTIKVLTIDERKFLQTRGRTSRTGKKFLILE